MQHQRLTDSRIANLGARAIYDSFIRSRLDYKNVTKRAKKRFESRDWIGLQQDATDRLSIYRRTVTNVVTEIQGLLEDRIFDKLVWASLKAVYSGLISMRNDNELAETYFNSVSRRIFITKGVDPQIEFVESDFDPPLATDKSTIYNIYQGNLQPSKLIQKILEDYAFDVPYSDLEADIELASKALSEQLADINALRLIERAEIIKPVFFRGQMAFIVGRVRSGSHTFPIVFSFLNGENGICLDALLMKENEVSILFSFTRSYFQVDVERPYDLVYFLKTIMPRKRVAEIYISLGHNKHGKTMLYRDILDYMATSNDRFEITRGKRGMVMIVFTLPGYDLVFKLIKDWFEYPKTGNRQTVIEKYHLVFKHDRAGRLVDAQEFEYLQFDKDRFDPDLLTELTQVANNTIDIDGDQVIIKHCYIERRMIPLDIYVEEASEPAIAQAIVDYGNSIRDMAETNIFPGDMMLKNFGVTRHGRVIFYDYDELCFLTQCNFRKVPKARNYEESMFAQPWYSIGENDVFPEEFKHFMGLSGHMAKAFNDKHKELLDVEYWEKTKQHIMNGKSMLILPYSESSRLR